MPLLTNKKATSRTPQVVTLIVDDSHSMQEPGEAGKSKAEVATESLLNLVMATQSGNQGSRSFRFLLNVAKFGDRVTPLAEAQPPGQIDLDQLSFRGDSGWTNMAAALEWAGGAVEKALAVCRALPAYDEANSPPPLVVFLSDGENTGPDVAAAAAKLYSIYFKQGSVAVIACGIGMKPEHFGIMKVVASNAEFAVNIDPAQLAEFIAGVGATVVEGTHVRNIVQKFADGWDEFMATGRKAVEGRNFPAAETAFMTALEQARITPDQRLPVTLTELTNLQVSLGDWTKALPLVQEALGLLSTPVLSAALPAPVQAAVGVAEMLQIAGQTPQAQDLWLKIASLWERPEAAKWADSAGKWSAFGFRDLSQGLNTKAEAAFQRAISIGGTGAAAAAKGLATINEPKFVDGWDELMATGRKAVEERNFPAAETAFMTALKQARITPDHRLPVTLIDLTNLQVSLGDWTKALPLVQEALGLLATPGLSTALPTSVQAAEGVAELLQVAGQAPQAENLWLKIASLWERPEAAKWVESAGKWSAFGFRDLSQGLNTKAEAAFQRAISIGGTGAAAAAKALATLNEPNGAEAAEPYLERLADLLAKRFGPLHTLAAKAIKDLRMSYVLQGKHDKAASLAQRYRPQ